MNATFGTRHHTALETPVGALTVVRTGAALSGVYFPGHRPAPGPARIGTESPDGFEQIRDQFSEYFDGRRRRFDLELAPVGTDFQTEVWAALRTIPYGETWTYSALAVAVGRPTSVRAVASANARNPLSIVVPCHRVIGMSGSITGFAGGVERKRLLLDLEAGVPTLFA